MSCNFGLTSYLWFQIKLALRARSILKSYAWFQNGTSAQREFDLKSQVWFQTKIAGHEVQLPLYYIHFEIAKLFSQYQYFIDQVAGLLKSRNKKAFTSHFVFETEMMRFIKQKWCDLKQKWCYLEHEWRDFFRAKNGAI